MVARDKKKSLYNIRTLYSVPERTTTLIKNKFLEGLFKLSLSGHNKV